MTLVAAPRQIVATATADAALTAGKHIPVDATSGARTMTLPTSVTAGAHLSVEKVDSSTSTVTISGSIRGSAGTYVLTAQYESVTLVADPGGSWWVISAGQPAASVAARYLLLGDGRLTANFPNVLPSGDTTGATDTAAIQANENAGRNTVLLPGFTYWVSGLIKKSSTHIWFNGAFMKLPAGANTDVIVGDQFASLTATSSTAGIHDFSIHGPGEINGNKANQTAITTVTSANFNMSASFTMTVANSSLLPSTGTASVNTQSGPQYFSWTANNTSTNTLTCTSASTGRVLSGNRIVTGGYGIRVYGYNFDIDGNLLVHDCAGDGLWTEWAPSVTVGSGTTELEARIGPIKTYENGRGGHSFLGPHDSIISNSLAIRNPGYGWSTGNSSIGYFNHCHGWGSPQQISFDDHTGSIFTGCIGEMTGTSGSRAWRIYTGATRILGGSVLWAGSGGQVGVELVGTAGAYIDTTFSGGFSTGAVLVTSSGGGNTIKGVVNNLTNRPMVSGTPDVTDVLDLVPGANTSTGRYSQGMVTPVSADRMSDFSNYTGRTHDPAALTNSAVATSGTIYLLGVKALSSKSITRLDVGVITAGSGLTSGQCVVGLYDSSGNLLATSSDQSSAWTSTGLKTASISSTAVTQGSIYYVAILAVGTTPPAFLRGQNTGSIANAGNSGSPFRFNNGPAAQTSLPSTITMMSGLSAGSATFAGMA